MNYEYRLTNGHKHRKFPTYASYKQNAQPSEEEKNPSNHMSYLFFRWREHDFFFINHKQKLCQ